MEKHNGMTDIKVQNIMRGYWIRKGTERRIMSFVFDFKCFSIDSWHVQGSEIIYKGAGTKYERANK
jgi:hypothetical protein